MLDLIVNDVGKGVLVFLLPILLAQNHILYEFAINIAAADIIHGFDEKRYEYTFRTCTRKETPINSPNECKEAAPLDCFPVKQELPQKPLNTTPPSDKGDE